MTMPDNNRQAPEQEPTQTKSPQQTLSEKNSKTFRRLFLVGIGMFGFAFALVPLYNLICQVGGINGVASNTGGRVEVSELSTTSTAIDQSRWVTVQFDATINANLPWRVEPEVRTMKVHPGEKYVTNYKATNLSDQKIIGQAIPGVTPWQATQQLHKIECFCFTQQTLQPNEVKEMPLHFMVDAELDKAYETITLSYSFMNTEHDKKELNKDASDSKHDHSKAGHDQPELVAAK